MSCRPGLPQRRGWCCSAWVGGTARGWPHRGEGDREDALHWSDVIGVVPARALD
jgi:hypothetical protein